MTSSESARGAGARVGAIVTLAVLVAGALLMAGLASDALRRSVRDGLPSSSSFSMMRWGCFALLSVPLARNVGIILVERRARMRWAAAVLGTILLLIYGAAFLEVRGGP